MNLYVIFLISSKENISFSFVIVDDEIGKYFDVVLRVLFVPLLKPITLTINCLTTTNTDYDLLGVGCSVSDYLLS